MATKISEIAEKSSINDSDLFFISERQPTGKYISKSVDYSAFKTGIDNKVQQAIAKCVTDSDETTEQKIQLNGLEFVECYATYADSPDVETFYILRTKAH